MQAKKLLRSSHNHGNNSIYTANIHRKPAIQNKAPDFLVFHTSHKAILNMMNSPLKAKIVEMGETNDFTEPSG